MSETKFMRNQQVIVTQPHNHIMADNTVYQIGSLDRISGSINAVLLKDGKCIGSIPENKLQAK